MSMALQRRLLQDIAEFRSDPYPNTVLCMQDNLRAACLLLTPSGKAPLHLRVIFGEEYPLVAPQVTIQSRIEHPNVFGSYICASILNTTEGYTPAYTLKSIAIQLLSFFSSERVEQEGGGYSIALDGYRDHYSRFRHDTHSAYICHECGFGGHKTIHEGVVNVGGKLIPDPLAQYRSNVDSTGAVNGQNVEALRQLHVMETASQEQAKQRLCLSDRIFSLPDEILLLILGELDTKDLLAAAKVESRVGDFMNSYDTIRLRELQCFCLKKTFMETKLGVGVHIASKGAQGNLESEFDLISQAAFEKFAVRQSIQGLRFEHWLPLPLSHRHWRSVSADAQASLTQLANAAREPNKSTYNTEVILNFMNHIVVKLSREAEQSWGDQVRSTLTHASEKAVEVYFSIFHLLLCLATEHDQIVRDVNRRLQSFLAGNTSKEACPNLGYLLISVLVSDQGLTQELTLAIIKEAILRNVVWMLDGKGAAKAELSYLEPSDISEYRLQRTFEASKISYRLLMFLALFCRTARGTPPKPISALRDELFDTHGAPPGGTAESMAAAIRNIRTVNSWPVFFQVMGLQETPGKETFCSFLKRTIGDSVQMGYSCQPITQAQALAIRQIREPGVEIAEGLVASKEAMAPVGIIFFPGKQGKRRWRR